MIAVRAARLYAWSRVGVGVALTVAPSMAVPSLADRGSLGAIRLVGVRDLALGVHALTVPGSGWRRTMLWCAGPTPLTWSSPPSGPGSAIAERGWRS